MNKDLRNIDKLFRSALDEHEENPPASVWDKIQNGLGEKKVEGTGGGSWIKRLTVAAALLIIAGGVFALYTQYYRVSKRDSQPITAQKVSGSRLDVSARSHQQSGVTNNRSIEQAVSSKDSKTGKASIAKRAVAQPGEADVKPANSPVSLPSENPLTPAFSQNDKNSATANDGFKGKSGPTVSRTGNKNQNNGKNLIVSNQAADARPLASRGVKVLSSHEFNRNGFSTTSFLNRPAAGNDSALTALIDAFLAKNRQSTERGSRLTLGLFFAPAISGRGVKDNDDRLPRRPGTNRDEIEQGEKRAVSLSTGLLFNYQLSSRWAIGSGIFDTRSVLSISPKKLYAEHDDQGRVRYRFNCTGGYSYIDPQQGPAPAAGDSAYASASKAITNYISVPLIVKYAINRGRFQLSPMVGVTANFLTGSKLVTALSASNKGGMATPVNGLASLYFNGLIAFEADYQVGGRISLFLQPAYTFSVTPSTANMPVRTYPNSIGFSVGTHFRL